MTAVGYTLYETGAARRRHAARHVTAMCALTLLLGALAFFLAPTGHVSLQSIVQINGVSRSVPAGADISLFADPAALRARPGPSLDVNGDVMALDAGSPASRRMNGEPVSDSLRSSDGAVIVVRHGSPVLEGIEKTSEAMSFKTTVAGEGKIVSLTQTGSTGERDVYLGAASGREAASLIVVAPRDTVYQLSDSPAPGQKLAALTFDDGPGTHTLEVLDALAAEHVPATFFVLGSSAAAHPEIIERMRAEGHEIENHTWNHPWLTKVSAAEFSSQISRTNKAIGGSTFLRPPYGDSDSTVRALANSMGLRLAFWTVDTRDWERQEVDAIMSHVKAETEPGAVILMHDGGVDRVQTVAAIPVVIDWLFSEGYSLTTVDQIL